MKYPIVFSVLRVVSYILVFHVPTTVSSPTVSHEGHHRQSMASAQRHDDWRRMETMDSNGLYLLEWWIKSKEIYFRATVNTQGFIGLGFSRKSTRMSGSDLVLLWVDDRTGKPNVLDCHGPQTGNGVPIQDDTQNYNIIDGFQNATHTQVEFFRQIETCDPYDLPFGLKLGPTKNSLVLNQLNHNDNRRLMKACASCSPQQLETVDVYGNTALLKACFLGNLEAVRILLSFHVNLHAINYMGQNALTLATYAGSYDIVCELLKYRSYKDFTLSSMIPPLCVAVLKGHQHLVELFQSIHPEGNTIRTVHGLTAADLQDIH